MIEVVKYNNNIHGIDLNLFCQKAGVDNIENNSSLEKLKLTDDCALYLIYYQNKIISLSYVHDFSNYYPNTWRCFTRTATLKKYRSKFFPFSKSLISCVGVNAYSLPLQVEYAFSKGAKQMVFTTNTGIAGGTKSSKKVNDFLVKNELNDPRYTFLEHKNINYVDQNVWRLNYKDIINLKYPI